ncbi:hypothetical protein MRX96_045780 [Rhipicephalus microplus]
MIAANCTMSCLNVEEHTVFKPMKNETPCVVLLNSTFEDLPDHTNFSCLLGNCNEGNCVGDDNCTSCIKFPRSNMVVSE